MVVNWWIVAFLRCDSNFIFGISRHTLVLKIKTNPIVMSKNILYMLIRVLHTHYLVVCSVHCISFLNPSIQAED